MKDIIEINCPYCGEVNEIYIDFSGGMHQSYIEECQICCRSWEIVVDLLENEPAVSVRTTNE